MKIGILNTGNIGSRLARAWAVADHQLVLAKDGQDRKIAPLLAELGDCAINAGPLKVARQLEQLGVLLHQVAEHEYSGDADLIRLGLAMIEANPGPIVRERTEEY